MKINLSVLSSKKAMTVLTFLGLFLISSGVSLAVFSYLKGSPSISPAGINGTRSKIDTSQPKTEACPLNGMMYTKAEKDIWSTRRPITAMIENHVDARPQAGLSKADIVYEAVAEGGITRTLSVFYCGVSAESVNIRPIRSARFYFINWAAEYGNNPLFVHQGGANNICNNCPGGVKPRSDIDPTVDAYKLLDKIGWSNGKYGNDMDGQTNLGYPAISRIEWKPNVAWEHQVTGSTDLLYEEAAKRGFAAKDAKGVPWDKGFVSWKFVDGKAASSPTAADISFEFWANKPDYNVEWKYDSANNNYSRFNGGVPHLDYNTKTQLTTSNVVVVFAKEVGPVDKELHMSYTVVGTGDAIFFRNGEAETGTWTKDTLLGRTKFTDSKGKEISFVRGPIWIEVLPKGNKVQY